MITKWFPKSIYFEPNILNEYLTQYEIELKMSIEKIGSVRDSLKNVGSTHRLRKNIFEVAELPNLREVFFSKSKYFLNELGYTELSNLHFDNCWANISKKGDYIFPHNHNGSLISGVYYVKSSLDDKITFFNSPSMLPDPNKWNELNYQNCSYSCIPGSLLLFTSDFIHGNDLQQSDEKIAISFNLSL